MSNGGKMNTFVKLVFGINFLFWGGGILIGFSQFVAYNGLGNIFEYVKSDNLEARSETDSIDKIVTIFYRYMVGGEGYESKQSISLSKVSINNFNEGNIYYNKQIPYFSYIGNQYFAQRQAKVAMTVSGIFFLFIFLIYRFADMEKWIGVYTRGEYKSSRRK